MICSAKPRRHLAGRRQPHHAHAADLRMSPYFLQRFFGRLAVQIQNGDGFATLLLTADGHLGDVDLIFAEYGADEAD